ncbi:MAG TPA: nitroreductase [Micromonosporaceae bacterium]|nr:nitroreductase [Micromonosporaceae bacterium]
MTDGKPSTDRPTAAVLAQAAATAGYAPSVHNTQPWQWRVRPERLELLADRNRQLRAVDPDARLLLLSCGAALHHARIALAGEGWTTQVERLPDPADPDLLARLVVTGPAEPDTETLRLMQAMPLRHTDRRPVSEEGVPIASLTRIEASVAGLARLHLLTGDQVLQLAAIAARAAAVQAHDPQIRAELEYWTTRTGNEGVGLPPEVLPAQPPQTTVPGRDFGRPGTLPVGIGHDRAAYYVLLFGDEDEPEGWLRGGEAMSAAWLTATDLGVSVLPLSGVVEVASTRATLRQILAGLGYPYVVLRLGLIDPEQPGPPHTPRLPAEQLVDTSLLSLTDEPEEGR